MVHLFLATLAAAAPTVEHAIIVKDWAVGCDNVLSCEAKSLDPGDQEPDIQISVDQGAGGDAPPSVEIVLKKSGLKLAIDGEPLPVDFDVEDGSYAYPVDPVGFLRLAVSGNQLQQQDESGQSIASASLDGLSAALRYIDDRQKRAGTRAALVAKGPLPSSRVPAALEYPKIKKPIRNQSDPAAPPRKLLTAKYKRICGTEWDSELRPAEVQRLDDRHSLVVLSVLTPSCGFGSYNAAAIVLVNRDGQAEWTEPKFDVGDVFSPCCEKMNGRLAEGAYWDDARDALLLIHKSRAIGDCGIDRYFSWDGAGFRLIKQQEMPDCRGRQDFITVWQAY